MNCCPPSAGTLCMHGCILRESSSYSPANSPPPGCLGSFFCQAAIADSGPRCCGPRGAFCGVVRAHASAAAFGGGVATAAAAAFGGGDATAEQGGAAARQRRLHGVAGAGLLRRLGAGTLMVIVTAGCIGPGHLRSGLGPFSARRGRARAGCHLPPPNPGGGLRDGAGAGRRNPRPRRLASSGARRGTGGAESEREREREILR